MKVVLPGPRRELPVLKLGDFFHLPQVDDLFTQIVAENSGLILVGGLDPRPVSSDRARPGLLPSGRSTLFRILLREILTGSPIESCTIISKDRSSIRLPREYRARVTRLQAITDEDYTGLIGLAIASRPGILVIDHLHDHSTAGALEAASQGLRVLSQIDSFFRGAQMAHHLLDLGAAWDQLDGLRWVINVQRLATLCSHCQRPILPDPGQLAVLRQRFPDLEALIASWTDAGLDLPPTVHDGVTWQFFVADGCAHCEGRGHLGDTMAFDIFRAGPDAPHLFEQPSLLPVEAYTLQLALLGHLSLDDTLRFETDQIRRMFHLLTASERALADSNATLERKLAQLETANHVLEERTRALISLQDLSEILLGTTTLGGLASRICRRTHELSHADRSVLYLLREDNQADVLAVSGWTKDRIASRVTIDPQLSRQLTREPARYDAWPPGIPPRDPDVEGARLRAGLLVPLVAGDHPVGLMIVHSTLHNRFAPGERALLQTFANQAALAIQRAGLIEDLRAKISQLEAAQVELAKKERLEHELELAYQVQQRVLPRIFPEIPGYTFAAHNRPARQVGGDFYDMISLGPERFGVAIADVSGKGMPAALYMALTRSLLLAEARRELSPAAVLSNVNELLLELGEPDMFVTVFYGVVHIPSGRLTYTRAGHDRPLLVRMGEVQELDGQGTALGLLDASLLNLSEEQCDLHSGDRLVLYTDGLTDVQSPEDVLYDRAQLITLVQTVGDLPPDQLCRAVFEDLAAYQGEAEQYDDMTMFVIGRS